MVENTVAIPRLTQTILQARAERDAANAQVAGLVAGLAKARRALERTRDEDYARPEEYAATGRDFAQADAVVIADAAIRDLEARS